MVHKEKKPLPWYKRIFEPAKLCYICGKSIKKGKYCRKCFNRYARPIPYVLSD